MNIQQLLNFCWCLVLISIGVDYISKGIFLMEIGVFLGLILFLRSKETVIYKKDFQIILGILVLMLGLFISRFLFTVQIPFSVNVLFIIKTFSMFLFIYFYITRFGFPYFSLYVIALFAVPHFMGLVLGLNTFKGMQFAGWHGDPNYLGPDLLASVTASLCLIFSSKVSFKRKLIFYFSLFSSIILIILTVSRTAIMSTLLIFLFFFLVNFWKKKLKIFFLTSILGFLILFFGELVKEDVGQLSYIERIESRFFESKKGADLYENERYYVWGLSWDAIHEAGLFNGFGIDEFIIKKYHFVSHNAWLDIGIKQGSYTFYAHSLAYFLGLILWGKAFFNNLSKLDPWGVESFIFIFSVSITFMMFSISVSHLYYYWFVLFLIYLNGFYGSPRFFNRTQIIRNNKI